MQMPDPAKLRELYERSAAGDVGLSADAFQEALRAVGQRYLPANATVCETIAFYRKLHLQDLALAQACAAGNAHAWACFLERFSSRLYAAALAISKNELIARDLAESLAGDLFVNRKQSLTGSSKMASYSGRGSLEGWLDALLTHTYIDRFRSQRRNSSLEHQLNVLKGLYVSPGAGQSAADPRLETAIANAFGERSAEERFLLAAYFFDGWTLAKIAQTLGIHESSVSRRMNGILDKLRRGIRQRLRKEGMSAAQMDESFSNDGWAESLDLRGLVFRGLVRE